MNRTDAVRAQEAARTELLRQTAECQDPANDCTAVDGLMCPAFNLAAANYAAAAAAVESCPPVPPAGGVLIWRDEDGDEAWLISHADGRVVLAAPYVYLPDHIIAALLDAAPVLTAEVDL